MFFLWNTINRDYFQDEEEFSKHVQILRGNLMSPLSAASMEQGSYYRGYEYITR